MKTAVIAANGCEEIECLAVVDIFRRAGVPVELVGLTGLSCLGSHKIAFSCDRPLDEDIADYDLIVLPGGLAGAQAMKAHAGLQKVLRLMKERNKTIAAICAAPIALEEAGILDGKKYTAYPGFEKKIRAGFYQNEEVVVDDHLITSRGPATAFIFAYTLLEVFGIDASSLKEGMQYNFILR